jgi:hypothetical protein
MANIIRDVVFRVQPKINFWFIGPLSQVLFEIAIKQATDLYLYELRYRTRFRETQINLLGYIYVQI